MMSKDRDQFQVIVGVSSVYSPRVEELVFAFRVLLRFATILSMKQLLEPALQIRSAEFTASSFP